MLVFTFPGVSGSRLMIRVDGRTNEPNTSLPQRSLWPTATPLHGDTMRGYPAGSAPEEHEDMQAPINPSALVRVPYFDINSLELRFPTVNHHMLHVPQETIMLHRDNTREQNVASGNPAINFNRQKLMYYIKEANVGQGFIKEPCFSPDGRVICSPYNEGTRLQTFNTDCSELPYCVPEKPRELCVLMSDCCHQDIVVSSKFSPVNCLLVTGSLSGDLLWYQPNF